MSGRRTLLTSGRLWAITAAVAAVLLGVAGWVLYEPGPMDFAGGRRVDLAAYLAPIPPAYLRNLAKPI